MNRHASMNRVYRLIWSEVRSAWVPVAETARGHGKSGRARPIAGRNVVAAAISLALAPLAHAAPPPAHAAPPCAAPVCGRAALSATSHPLGGKVVSGSASISQVGNTTDIRQSSADVAIDWLSFNIGSQATVDFVQPSASAVAVNRISGTNGSEILGDRLVHLQVDRSTLNNLAENRQLIEAHGGLVIMTAGAKDALLASVVNNMGVIEARTIENHEGTIELLGGMSAGTVKVGGTLDASAPQGGKGGSIETDAAHVQVANAAKVTTAASTGLLPISQRGIQSRGA
jgi:hypothetical protein